METGPRLRGQGWQVTTLAVGGLTTRAALQLGLAYDSHDWTVFCFGSNDAAPWKAVPLPEFSSNLHVLVRCSGKAVVIGPPQPSPAAEASGRTRVLLRQYASAAAAVADGCGAAYISLIDLLDGDDLAEDGIHLNDAGYSKIAERLVEVLTPPRDALPIATKCNSRRSG